MGQSDKTPGSGGARPPKSPPLRDGATVLPPDYRATFTKLTKTRFVSVGHAAGRWDVDVWANDLAGAALASRARDVPVGAVVVAEHYERSGTSSRSVGEGGSGGGAAGPVMVMEKRAKGYAAEHGDWRFVVVGSAGQVVKEGVIATCAGCHDDAPMDGFFPLPD